jgi:hypothetical protein
LLLPSAPLVLGASPHLLPPLPSLLLLLLLLLLK